MLKILPIIQQDDMFYFFDARLKQLRNCYNPHDFMDLNEFEAAYYQDIVNGKRDKHIKLIPFDAFKQKERNLP